MEPGIEATAYACELLYVYILLIDIANAGRTGNFR